MRGTIRSLGFVTALATTGCVEVPAGVDWHGINDSLVATGGLRQQRAAPDAPVDAATLTTNFRRVAFGVEPDPLGLGIDQAATGQAGQLRRWEQPIVYAIIAPGPAGTLRKLEVADFAATLSQHIGRPLIQGRADQQADAAGRKPNLLIMFVPDDIAPIRAAAAEADQGNPAADPGGTLRFITDWHGSRSPCAGRLFIETDAQGQRTGRIVGAYIFIRDSLPEPLLRACIEEEFAQTMGLPNDHPEARPSIFNDDQEFALLTDHDAALLRILYDPALRPGMPPELAMPIVARLARTALTAP